MRHSLGLVLLLVACGDKETAGSDTGEPDTATDTGDPAPVDADGDGFDAEVDCDDADADVYPGAAEVCDGVDNNCDGTADEGVTATFYSDDDGDGFGADGSATGACEAPSGMVSVGSDCDDSDSSVYPGAWEACDGVDQDCDGTIDDCAAEGATARVSGAEGENIGYAVDNSGDLDGDGVWDLVVGSVPNAQRPGAAWVLLGPFSGQHTTDEAVATISGDSSDDQLGAAAAIVGDYDEDGYDDLLVGAPGLGEWVEHGAAGLFYGPVTGDLGLSDADITFTLPDSGDLRVGAATDAIGDVTGDGVVDLVITAPGYDGRHYPQGIVCVVRGPVWGDVELTTNRNTTCSEGGHSPYSSTYLGEQVSGVGDLNGDGIDELAVGLQNLNTVYVYEGPFGYGQQRSIHHTTSSYAGSDVDGAGDTNGDGYADLVIGAYGEDVDGVTNAGVAYVLLGPLTAANTPLAGAPSVHGTTRTESVGYTVAGAGDLDHDGLDDVLIGAPWDSQESTSAGTVHIVYGPVSGSSAVGEVSDAVAGPGEGAVMGYDLGGGGGTALLAAPFADSGGDVLIFGP